MNADAHKAFCDMMAARMEQNKHRQPLHSGQRALSGVFRNLAELLEGDTSPRAMYVACADAANYLGMVAEEWGRVD